MAQVTDDELSVPPQLTESTNCRRPQVRFGILPHGRHEHNLIHIRTEATITDTLRTLISEKWKKRQGQRAEEGERDGYKGEPCAHEKYGSGNKSIGYGRSGNVRLSRKASFNNYAVECFAIKEYRRGTRETIKAYRNRSTLSFCISSCLRHTNVIDVLDIVQEPNGNYCEVMALCDGGDLATIILRSKKLGAPEADCFFKQLVCGVEYLHSVGVAHRDLKPDNLLLTSKGVLKIADFGEAECFRFPWEQEARMSSGRCGTTPYLAPELFLDGEYDSRLVDVWAMGMIYMAMRTGNILWSAALRSHGGTYARYLSDRKLHSGFRPIERLSNVGHISSTVVVK